MTRTNSDEPSPAPGTSKGLSPKVKSLTITGMAAAAAFAHSDAQAQLFSILTTVSTTHQFGGSQQTYGPETVNISRVNTSLRITAIVGEIFGGPTISFSVSGCNKNVIFSNNMTATFAGTVYFRDPAQSWNANSTAADGQQVTNIPTGGLSFLSSSCANRSLNNTAAIPTSTFTMTSYAGVAGTGGLQYFSGPGEGGTNAFVWYDQDNSTVNYNGSGINNFGDASPSSVQFGLYFYGPGTFVPTPEGYAVMASGAGGLLALIRGRRRAPKKKEPQNSALDE